MIEIKDIEKLAELSRLEIPQEEKEGFRKDLESILKYVGQIEDANIKSGAVDTGSASLVRNVLREDVEPHETGIFTDALLAEAPSKEDGYIKVKKIL